MNFSNTVPELETVLKENASLEGSPGMNLLGRHDIQREGLGYPKQAGFGGGKSYGGNRVGGGGLLNKVADFCCVGSTALYLIIHKGIYCTLLSLDSRTLGAGERRQIAVYLEFGDMSLRRVSIGCKLAERP